MQVLWCLQLKSVTGYTAQSINFELQHAPDPMISTGSLCVCPACSVITTLVEQ
jgi:hypothetical protein